MAKNLHVVPHEEGWAIKQEGEADPISVHGTQSEAVERGEGLARERKIDLIIHRQDGTFKQVQSFSNGDGNAGRAAEPAAARADYSRAEVRRGVGVVSDDEIRLHDVASVGSRVSWGALMAGAVVALTVYVALSTLGLAVGLTTAGTDVGGRPLAIAAAIWAAVSLLASLFLGGFITSRTTVGENKAEALTYGLLLWGTLFVALLVLSRLGMDTGFGGMLGRAYQPTGASTPALDDDALRGAGLTEEQARTLREARDRSADVDATTAAWWTFFTLLASIVASVAGSLVGAGPELSLETIRDRRTATGRPAAAAAR